VNTLTSKANLRDGREVTVTVEREGKGIYVSAIMPNGFNLCHLHHGSFLGRFNANPLLKSDKSRLKELSEILETIKEAIEISQKVFIDYGETVNIDAGNMSDSVLLRNIACTTFVNLHNIKSLDSGVGLSWYNHPVYTKNKTIPVTITRNEQYGNLELKAYDKDLYDLEALKTLTETRSFKEEKLAFFDYEEAKRLLGMEYSAIGNKSGLFS